MGVSGGVAIGSALGLEYALAKATHASAQNEIIAMMLGAIVAMMGSMALTSTSAWAKIRTVAGFPVALAVGMAAGVAVGSHTDLMLGVFVVVMFAAVYVRKLGPSYFFYGFQLWMGYFFASFTHATVSTLPSMLFTVVTASAWIALLSVTVLRTNPRRTLVRTRRAFEARARDTARATAALLEAAVTDQSQVARWRRRVAARQARLNEAALIIEAWSAEPGALPAGQSATVLRQRLLDAQLAIDGFAAAAGELAGGHDTARIVESARIAGLLAGHEYGFADRVAREQLARVDNEAAPAGPAGLPARHLAAAAIEFVEVTRRMGTPPAADETDEFAPAVSLAMGNLPGSAAFASTVAARHQRWNPLARLDFITRQAFQAAVAGGLAILIGREISSTRYYWAVLAAFIAFSGTATRSETSIKAINRVVGTLVGLFAGLGLAHATAGHNYWIITVVVLSMALGLYLMRVSYRYMIFFITIMIAQLYSVLHELSDGLLLLRLGETAAGAAIGIVVALVLAPLSTRDVVATVRGNLFTALGDLLRDAADRLDGRTDRPADQPEGSEGPAGAARSLDVLARTADTRLYQLMLAAAPLTRPLVLSNSPSRTRHRLTLYSAMTHYARGLAVAVRNPVSLPGAATATRALADAVATLADSELPGNERRSRALARLDEADAALFDQLDAVDPAVLARPAPDRPRAEQAILRALLHLLQVLRDLTTLGQPSGRGEKAERVPAPAAAALDSERVGALAGPRSPSAPGSHRRLAGAAPAGSGARSAGADAPVGAGVWPPDPDVTAGGSATGDGASGPSRHAVLLDGAAHPHPHPHPHRHRRGRHGLSRGAR
ncbi:hypothetical protein GCM10023322_64860 [Rugosimonospora acidiphila]|uniref:Integral membrane bound transporter domain-containing protein n=1 Tax=Rugosimonospora acidiphila TaxID=556531 RepID=A0ABP9SKG4_9ACTN